MSLVGVNRGCEPYTAECDTPDAVLSALFFGDNGEFISVTFFGGGNVFSAPSPATAQAQYGALSVSAAATFNLASPDTRFVVGSADATDTLTITAPGIATGTAGFLDVGFGFDGQMSQSGQGDAGVMVGVQWDAAGGTGELFNFYTSSSFTSGAFSARIPIFFGIPLELTYSLAAFAGTPMVLCTSCPDGVDFLEVSGTGSASSDFSHTLLLTSLVPLDAFENPIANPQFSSLSSTQYSLTGVVPTPEPGSLLLLGSGLALAALRWRQRSRPR